MTKLIASGISAKLTDTEKTEARTNIGVPSLTGQGASGTWPIVSVSAEALATARAITITGDADWTVNFKGDAGVSSALTLKSVVTAGTGTKITYNAKGLVTASTTLVEADIPNISAAKLTTGTLPNGRLSGAYTGITSLTAQEFIANSNNTPGLHNNSYYSLYGFGISASVTVGELILLGTVDIAGNSHNYTIEGKVALQASQQISELSFKLGIRSNTLPAKAFNFTRDSANMGLWGNSSIVVYDDPASNKVYICLLAGDVLHNLTGKFNVYTRSDYSSTITVQTTKTILSPTGLTLIEPNIHIAAAVAIRPTLTSGSSVLRQAKYTKTLIDTSANNVTITLNPSNYFYGDIEEFVKIRPNNVLTITTSSGVISLPDGTSAASHTLTGVRGTLVINYISATEFRLSAIY